MGNNQQDFIISLAWPEGMVVSAGSWYDFFASKNGKYRVGHSALLLINSKTNKTTYFDFGRYHTKQGFGRVRDFSTDPDLVTIDADINNGEINNLKSILLQISNNKSTHGEGMMYASVIKNIDFNLALKYAKKIQDKGMIPYGPFCWNGTNCSRFVSSVIIASQPPILKKIRFKFPFCISPSPKRNVCITNYQYYYVNKNICQISQKSKLKAYFSSIENNE
ncbi:hypothetical protein OAQ21_00495 [Flavobacteriales bacterium]|nr:hypothetical protein [Flavobacteriales bacterium]